MGLKTAKSFLLLILWSSVVFCEKSVSSSISSPSSPSEAGPPASTPIAAEARQGGSLVQQGPEPRQISSSSSPSSSGSVVSSSSGSFPYSVYQNSILSSLPQTPSSAGSSWLSILRPSQGGRRASLSSRLRNIYNAIFREQGTSPYVAQGSSLSYSLKQPPLSYGNFGVGSGFSAPSSSGSSGFSLGSLGSLSGLSSLTSGFGSLGSGLTNSLTNSLGSSLGQNNLFASASGYNPVVIPSGYSSQSGSSPSQDQSSYDSSVMSYLASQAGQGSGQGVPASSASIIPSSAASSSSQYGWSSSGPSSSYSPSAYSGYSSGSVASGSAPASYQVSSGSAPSSSSASSSVSSYSPSNYISSGSSYSGNQYQRSSSASAFKPIVGSTSYSSGLVGSSSSPSVTYSITSNKSREESRST